MDASKICLKIVFPMQVSLHFWTDFSYFLLKNFMNLEWWYKIKVIISSSNLYHWYWGYHAHIQLHRNEYFFWSNHLYSISYQFWKQCMSFLRSVRRLLTQFFFWDCRVLQFRTNYDHLWDDFHFFAWLRSRRWQKVQEEWAFSALDLSLIKINIKR